MSSSTTLPPRVSAFYEALREQLRSQYIAGRSPGERLPSERQLAKEFESSPMTVGRILQEFQAEGLLERVQGKGSFVRDPGPDVKSFLATGGGQQEGLAGRVAVQGEGGHDTASSHLGLCDLKSARQTPLRHTVIIASLSREPEFMARQYWTHRIVSVAELKLQRARVRTTILNRNEHGNADIQALFQRLKADGVDSALYLAHGLPVEREEVEIPWSREMMRLKHEMGQGLTVAHIHFGAETPLPFDSVTFDGCQGAFAATAHLAEQGHREICILSRSVDAGWVQGRLEGFWQALEMYGLDVRPRNLTPFTTSERIFSADESRDETYGRNDWPSISKDVVQRFFADKNARHRFTGIVALNDQVASEFIQEARRQGYSVPGDFSVVGYDDRVHSKSDGLTTVQPPVEEIAEVAAQLLLRRDASCQVHGKLNIVLNPSLVVRSSTRQWSEPAHKE